MLRVRGRSSIGCSGFWCVGESLSGPVGADGPYGRVELSGHYVIGADGRFMSEMRAITSTLGNAVATIVIAKWEHSCDHATLTRELNEGYVTTRQQLDEGALLSPLASSKR